MWQVDGRLKSIPLIALTAALLAGCGGGDDGPSGPGTPDPIVITTGDAPPPRFIPMNATVEAGGRITWRNGSPVAHNVTATTANWQLNRDLPVGGQFNTTLSQPGTYSYQCTIHAGMTGTVVVQ